MISRAILFYIFFNVLFAYFCLYVIYNGHLHEDAYILFRYVDNIVKNGVISFDHVSGPAEGATDFLWLMLISALGIVGVDPAISAFLLNSLGLACIFFFILFLRGFNLDVYSAVLFCVIFFSGALGAAIGGFSVFAYGGAFSLLLYCGINKKPILFLIMCLFLSLFRPDGVLVSIGVFFVYIAFSRSVDRKFIIFSVVFSVFGLVYFVWRYNYFDMILPLPLLVKSVTDKSFEGFAQNIKAISPYIIFLFSFFFFKKYNRKFYLYMISAGALILFIALIFSHQSQNVGYRFQFIIILSIIFIFAVYAKGRKGVYFLVVSSVFSFYFNVPSNLGQIKYLTNDDYINSLPIILREKGFGIDKIAVTEAGRFPYFYNAPLMLDLVGLNSRGIFDYGQAGALMAADPDLLFVHSAGRYMSDEFNSFYDGVDFKELDINKIELKSYGGGNFVRRAPEYALIFAKKNNFRAFAVRYSSRGDYNHFYFIDRGEDVSLFLDALSASHEKKITYSEAKNWD